MKERSKQTSTETAECLTGKFNKKLCPGLMMMLVSWYLQALGRHVYPVAPTIGMVEVEEACVLNLR